MTTQACTPIARNPVQYGSANWSWEFTLWQTVELPVIWYVATSMWRYCNEMDVLSLCRTDDLLSHPYETTLAPAYAIPISQQWLYMSNIASHVTEDTTVCPCASAAWQQRNPKVPLIVHFLGVSIGWFRCLPPFLRLTKQAGTPGFHPSRSWRVAFH